MIIRRTQNANTSTTQQPSSGGIIRRSSAPTKTGASPIQKLTDQASEVGLEDEAAKITDTTPKLSFIQRLSKGLGAFNPAEALLTGSEQESVGAGVKKYVKGIGQGIASAVTGTDYEGERRMFSDVAKQAGIDNAFLRFGIGLAGDILLDPSTYFGGAIAKGIGGGLVKSHSAVLKGVGKVVPHLDDSIRLGEKAIGNALGKGFVFGHGTSKGLPGEALRIQSKLAKAKEGIVASNISRLGTGALSKSQQQELVEKLLAGKRTELLVGRGTTAGKEAAKVAAQTGDDAVSKVIAEQTVRSKKFAKSAGLKDPYEIYFPGLRNDNLKKFFEGTKSLKVGSEGYLKQFKNLLKDDQLVKNPAEAFAKREFEIAKDGIVRTELQGIVKEFGKPVNAFKNADEAAKAGFQLVKEKGVFGRPLGYLADVDKKFIDNLISPEFTTIDILAKSTGFDAVTSLFKRSVTGLFAPFHVRNYLSGHVQNFEVLGKEALNPKNIAAGQKIAYKLATRDKTVFAGKFGKAVKAFDDRFGSSSQYISDIADATRGAGNIPGKIFSKESLKTTAKTVGLGQQAIPFRVGRAVGNFIETQQKATAYVTALAKGHNIDDALRLAEKAGFDYRALTPFESKVLRRIIPFYSFTRKNLELQLKTLGENPQRINQVIKTLENSSQLFGGDLTQEEKEGLPDYLKEQIPIQTGRTKDGLPEVAAGFQTPIEQPGSILGSNPLRRIFSTVNPILKGPAERAVNLDFFRNRQLKDVVEAGEYAKAPQVIKDWLEVREVPKKNKDGSERITYTANPYKLHLLRQLPSARGINYLGQVFSDEASTGTKWLNAITGFKPRPIDIETVNYFRDRDKQRELEDLLIRAGVLKRFERTYKPKQ